MDRVVILSINGIENNDFKTMVELLHEFGSVDSVKGGGGTGVGTFNTSLPGAI